MREIIKKAVKNWYRASNGKYEQWLLCRDRLLFIILWHLWRIWLLIFRTQIISVIMYLMNLKHRFSRNRFLLLLLAIILNSTLAVSERLSVLNSIERAQESKGMPPTSRCLSASHLYYTNPLDDSLAFQDARTGAVGLLGRLGESNCKVVCSHRTENPTLIGTFC